MIKVVTCTVLKFFFFGSNRADAHKQQVQNQEETGSVPTPAAASSATAVQDQRKALKFGFSAKGSTQRVFTNLCY